MEAREREDDKDHDSGDGKLGHEGDGREALHGGVVVQRQGEPTGANHEKQRQEEG